MRADAASRVMVLFVVPNLDFGGLQRAVSLTAQHVPENYSMAVASLNFPHFPATDGFRPHLAELGVPIFDLDTPKKVSRSPASALQAVQRLRAAIRESRPAVVESSGFDADLVSRLACLPRNSPVQVSRVVSTPYDSAGMEELSPVSRVKLQILRLVDAVTIRASDYIVANSESAATEARRALGLREHAVHVLPRGVDLERFDVKSGEFNPADSNVRLLSLGRLVKCKGVDVAIHALAEARDRGTDASLTIAGDGPERSRLESIVDDCGLKAHVDFIGEVEDVAGLMARHDALVFPTTREGMPNTVLEAMASGLPLIASDIPAVRETVGTAAIFGDPNKVASFADGIVKFANLSEGQRDALRSRLLQRSLLYSADAVTHRLFRLYGQWAAEKVGSSQDVGSGRGGERR